MEEKLRPEKLARQVETTKPWVHSEEMLKPEELAQRLNVERSWVYSQTRRKGPDAIPMVRVGKYCRFIASEVIDWLRARQHRRKN